MDEKQPTQMVECPHCHTEKVRQAGFRNVWHDTFEMGRSGPASSKLQGRVLTYWCEDCERQFEVELS